MHIYYTSGSGSTIKRFNVCTNSQLLDFAAVGENIYIESPTEWEVLMATPNAVYRVAASGAVLQTYPLPPAEPAPGTCSYCGFYALTLDADGSSCWASAYSTGNIYKFDIASGTILITFNTPLLSQVFIGGLAVVGGPTALTPTLIPTSTPTATPTPTNIATSTPTFTPTAIPTDTPVPTSIPTATHADTNLVDLDGS